MAAQGRLPVGHVVAGRYQVAACLGTGEMGEVYDVRDTSTGYAYALKLYRPEVVQRPDAIPAFERDARKIAELGVDSIAKVYEFGVEQQTGCPYSLGELVLLPSLQRQIAATGPLPLTSIEVILRTLAPAFDRAHQAGFVHRGVKPTNLFASQTEGGNWEARVTEFGQASLRLIVPPPPGWTATPGWLSAEQADPSIPASPAMDVYTLGLVVFYALTGRSVFRAAVSQPPDLNLLWSEMTAPLPPASARARELGVSLTPSLDPWFARALSVSPAQRFRSVGEMSQALWALIGSSQHIVTMRPPPGVAAAPPASTQPSRSANASGPLGSMKQTLMYGMQAPPPPGFPPPQAVPEMPSLVSLVAEDEDDMPTRAMSREQFESTSGMQPEAGAAFSQRQHPTMPPGSPASMQAAQLGAGPGQMLPPGSVAPAMPSQPAGFGAAPDALPQRARSPYLLPLVAAGSILAVGGIVITIAVVTRSSGAATAPTVSSPPSATASAAPSATAPASVAAAPSASAPPPPAPKDALVKITCDPECDELRCDGKAVEMTASGIRLDPGKHECKGSKKGYTTAKETFEVKAGDEVSKTLTLTKVAASGPAPARTTQPANTTPPVKTSTPSKTPAPAKTCGSFLNPCK
ncbi:MAG TPA: serine/threonine-protein kinase [Polyangiaceae bacterium]|nr:serine/threonine-protein kinase [Polyangiaceae bacterium]